MKKKNVFIIMVIIILIITLLAFYCYYFSNGSPFEPVSLTNDKWIYDPNSFSGSYSNIYSFSSGAAGSASASVQSFTSADSFMSRSASADTASSNRSLGFSTGGAKNVDNFRENIKNNYFPISTDITYNGLFYDYSFDTGNSGKESDDLFYPSYSTAVSKDPISQEKEYYMSVGLNSNIKESDFKRPKLNLVVVLDNSGSMSSSFDSYYYDSILSFGENKSKMEIADESVGILLDELNPDDRFGMVVFNSSGQIAMYLNEVSELNINNLKNSINKIDAMGGTNFEDGYNKALEIFEKSDLENNDYQNRIIVITDAMPNTGELGKNTLMGMVQENSDKGIYTSFIGVGVDFNTELIEKLGTVKGANYYSVHSAKEFKKQMGEDFDYMVTPLVFDLNLDFKSDGYTLEEVYGTDVEDNKTGNIMHVNTLFPSARNDDNEVKGGIIILKLKKNDYSNSDNITLEVSYNDKEGNYHSNTQNVVFNNSGEYYENTGIRKGIVLARYVNLLKDWILYERSEGKREFLITPQSGIICPENDKEEIRYILGQYERTSVKLTVSEEYHKLFTEMRDYIKSEKDALNDKDLKQEIDILNKLINVTTHTFNNQFDYEVYTNNDLDY